MLIDERQAEADAFIMLDDFRDGQAEAICSQRKHLEDALLFFLCALCA